MRKFGDRINLINKILSQNLIQLNLIQPYVSLIFDDIVPQIGTLKRILQKEF